MVGADRRDEHAVALWDSEGAVVVQRHVSRLKLCIAMHHNSGRLLPHHLHHSTAPVHMVTQAVTQRRR